MREIKFRQRTTSDKWHYWGFINGGFVSPLVSEGIEDCIKHSQQFTGLLDKNGVEIYEGDIIKVYLSAPGIDEWWQIFAVVFENGKFQLKAKTELTDGYWFSDFEKHQDYLVVGNIYENPELLEKV
jgi:uncharacterized phage protein (TIGR01671 family)